MIRLSGKSRSGLRLGLGLFFFVFCFFINVLSFDFLKGSVTYFFLFLAFVDVCVCPFFRPWWTSAVGLHARTKVPVFRRKQSPDACVHPDGPVLTVMCPVSPVRWRPPTEVSSVPQTQGQPTKLASSILGQVLLWEESEGQAAVDGQDSGEMVWNGR